MPKSRGAVAGSPEKHAMSLGLLLFCFALMGPAFAINSAFIAIAVPAMAPYGVYGLVMAGLGGSAFGIFPALWLARRIHEGIRDE